MYLDTSILVAYYCAEDLSEQAEFIPQALPCLVLPRQHLRQLDQ